ncbi:MAG: extracellular solute-binding protein [Clostridia bacterium]|nr:extracellular solute-binding protein [Clostridia bacterium]
MKKVLSVVLAALLSLALPCPALCEDRPVLTIGDVNDRSSKRVDGENQLGMWRYLEDLLDVEIHYIHMQPDAYAAALANGNLPDIVSTNNNLSTIRESGVALDLDPYLEEYVPNFLQGAARQTYDVFKQLGNGEEGFYFFPARIGYNNVGFSIGSSYRGYILRWDYYAELGYPPIHNEDDYLDVLMRMHENHPFTEEGFPTYLYGTNDMDGYETAFRAELDLDYWAAYKYQNNIFTNEIYDGYTDTAHSMWWTSMAWLNKLYKAGKADGSFDMDIFTQTNEQYSQKRRRGQYLGLPAINVSLYREKVGTDPDTLSGYCAVPSASINLYNNVYQLLGNGSAYMWFISANSPHKEAALRLFNYMCDPDFLREVCMGRRGETWDYDEDGVPQMNEYGREQLDAFKTGTGDSSNYYAQWGSFNDLPNNWPILRENLMHPDGYPLDFATLTREYGKATMTNNLARDICAQYEVELPLDAFYKFGALDFRNDCGEAISSTISSMNSDQLHLLAKAEAILKDAQVGLVLADNEEEYDAIREETIRILIELGEPEVFEAYREKWDAAAAIVVPMVWQVQRENGIEPYAPEQYERQQ